MIDFSDYRLFADQCTAHISRMHDWINATEERVTEVDEELTEKINQIKPLIKILKEERDYLALSIHKAQNLHSKISSIRQKITQIVYCKLKLSEEKCRFLEKKIQQLEKAKHSYKEKAPFKNCQSSDSKHNRQTDRQLINCDQRKNHLEVKLKTTQVSYETSLEISQRAQARLSQLIAATWNIIQSSIIEKYFPQLSNP